MHQRTADLVAVAMTTIAGITVGGVWLFAVIASADPSAPDRTLRPQAPFKTTAQCERVKAAILARYPHAYVTCDGSGRRDR
jgi:hypothetical protein